MSISSRAALTSSRFEDLLGKALLCTAFAFVAAIQIVMTAATVSHFPAIDYTLLAAQAFTLVFTLMNAVLTITRLPAKESAAGAAPRAVAIVGTFILLALLVLPHASIGSGLRLLAAFLIAAGTMLSMFCLGWLGRSFSVMATARRLVVSGPYSVIRHPLYVAEAISSVGVVIFNWSAAAAVIGILWIGFQYRRTKYEESVLRAVFPEYEDYARRVPPFFPRLSSI